MQKRITRSTTPARTRRIARRIRLRRRRADWLREPLPFVRERLLPEGFQADRADLHPLSLDNFSAQTFHPAQHAVVCMFASSSTLRPATVGQGLLCVLVGTGTSVSADLKIGGSPPPPARIEIHRAIADGGNSPDGMCGEQRGNMAGSGQAGRGWIKAICRAQCCPPPEGPVNDNRRNGQ